MPSFSRRVLLLSGILRLVLAQDGPMSLCTAGKCEYCPNTLTTAGTGYPQCVVYDRDTVLGGRADEYEELDSGKRNIWFDIAPVSDPQCKTIIRSPAGTTDPNCGIPIYAGTGGLCFSASVASTMMVQFCCGTGDCAAAGASKRSAHASGSFSSIVLKDGEGNVIIPHFVGDGTSDTMSAFLETQGLNTSTAGRQSVESVKVGRAREKVPIRKRDCDTYIPNGDPYTKTGTQSYVVSARICDSNSKVTITNSNSVSRTTSFSTSVSDPFGIVSASIGFETTETEEQSYSYEFTPNEDQCGHVAWTPFFICSGGKITGCEGGDQTGEVCTAQRFDDKQLQGAYQFVQTG